MAYIWSLLAGVLLALPFKFPACALVSWIGLIPFLISRENKSNHQSFLLGWIMGLGFLAVSSYWLIYPVIQFSGYHWLIAGLIVSLALLILALFFGIFSFLVNVISEKLNYSLLVIVPIVWTSIEIIRTFFSFQFLFGFLGYSQSYIPELIQLAEYGSVYLISFLIALVNVLFYQGIKSNSTRKKAAYFIIPVLIVGLIYGYGKLRMNYLPAEETKKLTIGGVQPSIPQRIKLNPSYETYIANKLQKLSNQLVADEPIDLLIWPETAVLRSYNLDKKFPYQLKQSVPMLVGGLTRKQGKVFNSALLVDEKRNIIKKYSKNKLVPWGEYVPVPQLVPDFIETNLNHLNPGTKLKDFNFKNINFITPICSEILHPFYLHKLYSNQNLIITISNEAWFAKSNASSQILQATIFRAVETRTPIVKIGNTGISGVVNHTGELLFKTKLFTEVSFPFTVQLSKSRKTKNNPFVFSLIIIGGMIYLLAASYRQEKKE